MDLSSKLVIITMPKYKGVWVFQEGNGLIGQSIVTTAIWRMFFFKRNLYDFCLHGVVLEIITRKIKRRKPLARSN